ncbi:MAG: hypothetical protein BGP10_13415 [Rhodanobacter sp. 68-29]|nr:hypothetical protein [Rhodanobacter sp.]ODU92240.1 MAG: hypothetical protein ABT18_13265 [Rhodanobacter sp. SCN 66-43]OJY58322.1 MAG: hypothetical protein BGP10_13415 [Rhodanobacter sp. 68-29]
MPARRIAALRGAPAVAAGLLLLVLGIALAVWTERSLANYRAALQQHGGAVTDLGADAEPQPGLQGKLVRISGTPRVVVPPLDADFGQHADTPLLARRVEMFQWRELRLGNSVTYELDWADKPQDSSRFAQPNGHANPGPFAIAGKRFEAGQVQLGGYMLDAALVRSLPGSEAVAPDMKALPANLAASFSLHDKALVTSAKPGSPRLGDLRVSWRAVPLQEVTMIARVAGDRLVAAPNAADGGDYGVNVGDSALLDMRPDMAAQPGMAWLRRILAVLLAAAGAGLLLQWRGTPRIDPAAALGGGLLVVGVFAALPWLGSSTLAAVLWLVAALAGVGLLVWRRRAPVR